jgi:hypothetical protein
MREANPRLGQSVIAYDYLAGKSQQEQPNLGYEHLIRAGDSVPWVWRLRRNLVDFYI